MKPYRYFVSYAFLDNGVNRFGNLETQSPSKIFDLNQLSKLQKDIEHQLKLPKNSVCIINFVLFENA